ncbi:AAA family ATPase [Ruminococcus albus]|uniref:Endonuclease GajA/Old nuclease/RecF-like AAA domain-containing protein n=1 Tax=Ruminococcus albus 8 TaxID=246199 RepID=E9S9L4_RUMAL|nr:AAA family ATPase [Ruminococcus albus]EGC04043.1 hypothetical protein CUS_4635 [Ruminococcus albus 8]MCC3351140.1 AAA family ATPase [Ruminococcus albus 8]
MNLKIKNFGKIAEADIKLDGITVICGKNNTGKSTVGKALFSFYNALNDYKNKIDAQKNNKLKTTVRNYVSHSMNSSVSMLYTESSLEYIAKHVDRYSLDEVKEYIESIYSVKIPKDRLVALVEYLNTPEKDILNEYVYRYITGVMNGQVKNVLSSNRSQCYISGEIQDFKNTIKLKKYSCNCDLVSPIEHSAYYINTPFSLDILNEHRLYTWGSSVMSRNVIDAIQQAQADINEDSMTNIIDSVLNKKELEDVRKIIKKAYCGETIIDHEKYYYSENGISVDFRNMSAGLKSFALIERLLETGVLKKKDVLILDEPEIHLHSEWQIIYAELIVILQKTFDLTVLLVTHSFQFLESIDFFMKKYGTLDNGNYYIPDSTEKGFIMKYYGKNPEELKKNLSTGSFKIADLEFEYDMEQEDVEE